MGGSELEMKLRESKSDWESVELGGWGGLLLLISTVSSTAHTCQAKLCSEIYPGRPHESCVLCEIQPEWGVAGKFV